LNVTVTVSEYSPAEVLSMAAFLEIGLPKEAFHACLLSDRADAKKVFPNTPKGFE
jgi:hypothetical protein